MGCRLSAVPALPFSAGYKIYDLTLTPAQSRLAAGERLVLSCLATTELNVGIEFNWTHSGHALVSAAAGTVSRFPCDKVTFFFVSLERHISFRGPSPFLTSDLGHTRDPPQAEVVEQPGAVQHAGGGQRDGGPHGGVHLHRVQRPDGEKRNGLLASVW